MPSQYPAVKRTIVAAAVLAALCSPIAKGATYTQAAPYTPGMSPQIPPGASTFNINSYTDDIGSFSGPASSVTVNGPGTLNLEDGGVVNNAALDDITVSTAAYSPWVSIATTAITGGPDDYAPLMNGTLSLNNVTLYNGTGIRAGTLNLTGTNSFEQTAAAFSGSIFVNNVANTGNLTISGSSSLGPGVYGAIVALTGFNNTGQITVDSGGGLSLGYVLSGLPESYTGNLGDVTVNGGQLQFNNLNLTGTLAITGSAAFVQGYGSFNGDITNTSGSFFPGNNMTYPEPKAGVFYAMTELPNTLTLNGNFTQGGNGTYVAYIWPGNNQNTRLVVNGTANLGGTLAVTANSQAQRDAESGQAITTTTSSRTTGLPTFTAGNYYNLISAENITGSFSKVVYVDNTTTTPVANRIDGLEPYLAQGFDPSLGSDVLRLTLCAPGSGNCGVPLMVVNPSLVTADSVPHTSLVVLKTSDGAVVDNIIGGAPRGTWVKAIGGFGQIDGFNASGAGAIVGHGFRRTNAYGRWTFGPAFSYGYNRVADSFSRTHTNSYGFWLYGGWQRGPWKVSSVAGGGFTNNTELTTLGSASGQSGYNGSFYAVAARPSYWFHLSHGVVLSPRLTLNYGSAYSSGFTQSFAGTLFPTPSARYSVFSTEPAVMVGDVLHPYGLKVTPQIRLGVDENTGAATGTGLLPKTEGTVEARVNVRENRRLRGTLSWQYAYGRGSGFHYNTVVASAKYLW
jgi:hypothetical protein